MDIYVNGPLARKKNKRANHSNVEGTATLGGGGRNIGSGGTLVGSGTGTVTGSGGTLSGGGGTLSGGGCQTCSQLRCGTGYQCVTQSSGCATCVLQSQTGGGATNITLGGTTDATTRNDTGGTSTIVSALNYPSCCASIACPAGTQCGSDALGRCTCVQNAIPTPIGAPVGGGFFGGGGGGAMARESDEEGQGQDALPNNGMLILGFKPLPFLILAGIGATIAYILVKNKAIKGLKA